MTTPAKKKTPPPLADQSQRDLISKSLDATLIVLEGRPADLPLENPYRPFLELAQMQLRTLRSSDET